MILGETRLSTPGETEFLSLVIDPVSLRVLCYASGFTFILRTVTSKSSQSLLTKSSISLKK